MTNALLAVLCSVALASGESDHVDELVVGAEVRGGGALEVLLPHGVGASGRKSELIARLGYVLEPSARSVLVPIMMGWYAMPFPGVVRPVGGLEFGGYLDWPKVSGMRPTFEWLWAMRAALGFEVRVLEAFGVRVLGDYRWVQASLAAPRESPASGLGWSIALLGRFALSEATLERLGAP